MGKLTNLWTYLRNGDAGVTVLQNVEELDASAKFNDDAADILPYPALLTVNPFNDTVDKDADIHIMFRSGTEATIKAWQAMVRCYSIVKIFQSGTTVDINELKLNR
jgi:hypothetical protein